MAKYRKKPVVIDAVLFDGKCVGASDEFRNVVPGTCPEWFPAVVPETHPDNKFANPGEIFFAGGRLCIGTLEGTMVAEAGDWIIRGVKGEIYPCKPDIFAATYEPA